MVRVVCFVVTTFEDSSLAKYGGFKTFFFPSKYGDFDTIFPKQSFVSISLNFLIFFKKLKVKNFPFSYSVQFWSKEKH
jgi:hypothetical protein